MTPEEMEGAAATFANDATDAAEANADPITIIGAGIIGTLWHCTAEIARRLDQIIENQERNRDE